MTPARRSLQSAPPGSISASQLSSPLWRGNLGPSTCLCSNYYLTSHPSLQQMQGPTPQIVSTHTFIQTGLHPYLCLLLAQCGYQQPTPIQYHSIKTAIDGPTHNLICRSKSGTGKTISYLGLVLHGLVSHQPLQNKTHCIILVPTRQLAVQIYQTLRSLLDGLPCTKATTQEHKVAKQTLASLNAMLAIGGLSFEDDLKKYRESVAHVLICTAGRLWQLFRNNTLVLSKDFTVVFDEGDKLFNSVDQKLKKVLKFVQRAKWVVFSATYDQKVMRTLLAVKKWMYVQTGVKNGVLEAIVTDHIEDKLLKQDDKQTTKQGMLDDLQNFNLQNIKKFTVRMEANGTESHIDQKLCALSRILNELHYQKCLIFVQKKSFLQQISQYLSSVGLEHILIHGSLSQAARFRMMNQINNNRVIIASDLLARGIDVKLDLVILFDVRQGDTFWHRIGRTGRYGRTGVVVSLEQIDAQNPRWSDYNCEQVNRIFSGIDDFQKKEWYGGHMTEIGKWQDFDTNKQEQNGYKYFDDEQTIKQITRVEQKTKANLQLLDKIGSSANISNGGVIKQIKSQKQLQQFIRSKILKCAKCLNFMEATTQLTGYRFQILKYAK